LASAILLVDVLLSGLAALVRFLLAALTTLLALLPALLALLLSRLLAGALLILAFLLLLTLLARLVVLVHAFLRGWGNPSPRLHEPVPLPPGSGGTVSSSGFLRVLSDICSKPRRACFRGCNMA